VGVPIDKSTRAAILVCIGLTLITFAAFWPVLQNDFINYDDTAYVTENAHVLSGLSWDNLTWAFRTGYFANWHPLTWVSHMLDVELFGLNPHGHHFTSLFFHVANTMVLFLLLRGMSGQEWPSAFVAALFALHPLHVESVAWVSERKDVLSAFFGLLTLWAYGKSKGSRVLSPESRVEKGSRVQSSEFGVLSRGSQVEGEEPTRGASRVTHHVSRFFYFLALFFFALALMCKAMLVTLPFVMLLLDFWPLRRLRCRCVPSGILDEPQKTAESKPENPNGPARSIWPFVLEKIPFFALSAASTILGFYLLKGEGAISDSPEIGLGDRVAHSLIACEAYLGKLLWPAALALPYPRAAQWSYWQVILGVALVVGLSLLALSSAARRPYVTVGWLWFLGMLTPVIGIVPLGAHAFADRYTYLPLIGLFIAGVWAATEAASARTIRTALAASGIILLTALATITHRQLGYWRNSEQLYLHTLAVTRDNFIAHNGLGLVFFNQFKIEEAIFH
jgi:hypothetical protein